MSSQERYAVMMSILKKGGTAEVERGEGFPESSWVIGRLIKIDYEVAETNPLELGYKVYMEPLSSSLVWDRYNSFVKLSDCRPNQPSNGVFHPMVDQQIEFLQDNMWRGGGRVTHLEQDGSVWVNSYDGTGSVRVEITHVREPKIWNGEWVCAENENENENENGFAPPAAVAVAVAVVPQRRSRKRGIHQAPARGNPRKKIQHI